MIAADNPPAALLYRLCYSKEPTSIELKVGEMYGLCFDS